MSGWDAMWPNYGTPAIELVSGQGSQVQDATGRCYTDLLGGIAVNVLGHAHPAIVAAVSQQIARLGHTSNLYANPQAIGLAGALQDRWPGSRVFLGNSGAEANEAALKLMRRHAADKQRPGGVVLAFQNAFHGRTAGALALTWNPAYKAGCGPLPEQVVHLPFNDVAALEAAFVEHDVIGVFLECIQGEGGIRPATPQFTGALRRLCDQHSALLCVDEIQTGMGRTGRFFAFEHHGIQPDIVTLAKGLGGGLPIGATLCRAELAALMGPGVHGSTFGGNPVACAAAVAVLDALEPDVLAEAANKGDAALTMLAHAGLTVRGQGLLIGIDVDDAPTVVAQMRDAGYLVGQAGPRTIRLAPALNIPFEDLMGGIEALLAFSPVPVR